MQFYYIYKSLAHPENNGYVQPFNLKERLMHVAEAKKKLGSRFQWICDSMDNQLKHTFGDRPNSEFLFGPDGTLISSRTWSSPADLRADLEKHVGPVTKQTQVADLDLPRMAPATTAATGVVPRLTLPGTMMPVFATPQVKENDQPFYVKLRAEVDSSFFSTGSGKLYLGFFLDPLYHVHWNNRAMPVMFEVEQMNGVFVGGQEGVGPDVEADADADPREFLVDLCTEIDGVDTSKSAEIVVKVKYFACDDAETFCKPVTQRYLIVLERDKDGGSRRSTTGRGGAGRSRGGFSPGQGGPGSRTGQGSRRGQRQNSPGFLDRRSGNTPGGRSR